MTVTLWGSRSDLRSGIYVQFAGPDDVARLPLALLKKLARIAEHEGYCLRLAFPQQAALLNEIALAASHLN